MKHTLILYESIEKVLLFKVDKDLSHLNGIYIGQDGSDIENELNHLIYTNDGDLKLTELKEPTKDWTWFIKCGEV